MHPSLAQRSGLAFAIAAGLLATPVVAHAQDKIGVEACDSFLSKFEVCIADKVPGHEQRALQDGVEQMRNTWRPVSTASPQAKDSIAATCRQLAENVKQQMAPLDCQW